MRSRSPEATSLDNFHPQNGNPQNGGPSICDMPQTGKAHVIFFLFQCPVGFPLLFEGVVHGRGGVKKEALGSLDVQLGKVDNFH